MSEREKLIAWIDDCMRGGLHPALAAIMIDVRAYLSRDQSQGAQPVAEDCRVTGVTDLEEFAWALIANAGEGNWTRERKDWQEAAARWRDQYHAKLAAQPAPDAPPQTDLARSKESP